MILVRLIPVVIRYAPTAIPYLVGAIIALAGVKVGLAHGTESNNDDDFARSNAKAGSPRSNGRY